MTNRHAPISRGQYASMVGVSIVSGGAYLWPQYLVLYAGSNGIYTFLTTTAIALALTMLQVAIALNARKSTFLSDIRAVVPIVGVAVVFPMTAALMLISDGLQLALFGFMLKTNYYPNTPHLASEMVILFAAGWIAGRTLSTVSRITQLLFSLLILLFYGVCCACLGHLAFLSAVMPSSTLLILPWWRTVLGTWFLYGNGGVVGTLTPHVAWSRPRDAYVTAGIAILVHSLSLLLLYVICLGTLGPNSVAHLNWPSLFVFSLVMARGFFLQALGSFVMIIFSGFIIVNLAVHLFCFTWSLSSQLQNPSSTVRWGLVGASLGLLAGVTLLIPSVLVAQSVLIRWLSPITLIWSVAIMPILWWLSRRYRKVFRQRKGAAYEHTPLP